MLIIYIEMSCEIPVHLKFIHTLKQTKKQDKNIQSENILMLTYMGSVFSSQSKVLTVFKSQVSFIDIIQQSLIAVKKKSFCHLTIIE